MIAVACKVFGLDANDKTDRDLLLGFLADVIFRERGKAALGWEAPKLKAPPGRHKTWDARKQRLFQRDIFAVMDGDPHMTVRKIRQRLQKLKSDYSGFKNSTLEKYIERELSPPKKSE